MEFVKFCMELTKFCVELVWMLCFCVELVWILNLGFIPTFGLILGLIVGWFYAMFLACFVSCLWHVLWPQLGGYCGWCGQGLFWNGFGLKWHVPELPRSSLARCYVEATLWLGSKLKPSGTQLHSPCTPSSLQLRMVITSSFELCFGCS